MRTYKYFTGLGLGCGSGPVRSEAAHSGEFRGQECRHYRGGFRQVPAHQPAGGPRSRTHQVILQFS